MNKNNWKNFFIVICLILIVIGLYILPHSANSASSIWYVNGSLDHCEDPPYNGICAVGCCSDTLCNGESTAQSFCNIQAGADELRDVLGIQPHIVYVFGPGHTYYEQVNISKKDVSTSESFNSIRAMDEGIVLDGCINPDSETGVCESRLDYGFYFVPKSQSEFMRYVHITNFEIKNYKTAGIFASTQNDGGDLWSFYGARIENNHIHHNGIWSTGSLRGGIVSTSRFTSHPFLHGGHFGFYNNIIHDNGGYGININDVDGSTWYGDTQGFYNNIIYNNTLGGMKLGVVSGQVNIWNNLIFDALGADRGIDLSVGGPAFSLINNTISGFNYGFYDNNPANNYTIKNNIIVGYSEYGIKSDATTGITYNDIWTDKVDPPIPMCTGSANCADASNISVDPLFSESGVVSGEEYEFETVPLLCHQAQAKRQCMSPSFFLSTESLLLIDAGDPNDSLVDFGIDGLYSVFDKFSNTCPSTPSCAIPNCPDEDPPDMGFHYPTCPYNEGWVPGASCDNLSSNILFQIKTALDEAGLSSAQWMGPDGTENTYYETSGQTLNIQNPQQWIQYRMSLSGNGTFTPVVNQVKINHQP